MMASVSVSTDLRPRTGPTGLPGSPAAERHRRAVWRDPRLFVGVALVAVSVLLGATLLGGGDSGVAVWAARTPLAEGQSLTAADLVRREVRFVEQAHADRYLSADAPLPDGAALTRAVGEGELVPRSALRSGSTEGIVEVPLGVAPTALPATVQVGSVVDVWVVPASGDPTASVTARRVLAEVSVLHVSRGAGPLGAGAERQVIVGVRPGQQDALPDALAGVAGGSVVLTRTR
jgi:hypothetical protein